MNISKTLAAALAALALAACTSPTSGGDSSVGPVVVSSEPAVLVGAAGAATGPALEEGWTRFEAEDADITAGIIEAHDFYSGGNGAGGLDTHTAIDLLDADWTNVSNVKFTLPGLHAGNYTVRIAYNGDDNKSIAVRLNGAAPVEVPLPTAAGQAWNQLLRKEVTAPMVAGTNAFWVSGVVTSSGWANIDYIEIQPVAQ